MRTYLDHNATSPLRPEAKQAMTAAMDVDGNASSIHAEGRNARKHMDDSRDKLAFHLGCLPPMLTFTSGGTEANNMALRGVAVERILISAVEHPSVKAAAAASGKPVEIIPVDRFGSVDLNALEKILRGPKALVSVMFANNETGVIQPVQDIVALASKAGALTHVDAVQAFGKTKVNFGLMGVDMMTVGAHKVGGPTGIGALIIRDGLVVEPLLHGGGQELRRRPGTENLIGMAGFAALTQCAEINVQKLTSEIEQALEGSVIFGQGAARLNNTIYFGHAGMRTETLLMSFDLESIAVSSGSACSSGKVAHSNVLQAMGVAPVISAAAIRVSLGWNTTPQDAQNFIATWQKISARHRAKHAA